MPYLILLIGLIIGIGALLLLFTKAKPNDIKKAIQLALLIVYALVLLFFAFTGRIIISILLLIIFSPFIYYFVKSSRAQKAQTPKIEDKNQD
ncbi:MAG: hypothetical protein GC137_05685 [Alphaproteobacteria bacterium]|nr:hypothetical protein [Alphaproteobacteria bacterium]